MVINDSWWSKGGVILIVGFLVRRLELVIGMVVGDWNGCGLVEYLVV